MVAGIGKSHDSNELDALASPRVAKCALISGLSLFDWHASFYLITLF
jgi:hypothetical protein